MENADGTTTTFIHHPNHSLVIMRLIFSDQIILACVPFPPKGDNYLIRCSFIIYKVFLLPYLPYERSQDGHLFSTIFGFPDQCED